MGAHAHWHLIPGFPWGEVEAIDLRKVFGKLKVELPELGIATVDVPLLITHTHKHLINMMGIRATPLFDDRRYPNIHQSVRTQQCDVTKPLSRGTHNALVSLALLVPSFGLITDKFGLEIISS